MRFAQTRVWKKALTVGIVAALASVALLVAVSPAQASCARTFSWNRNEVQVDNCAGNNHDRTWAWAWKSNHKKWWLKVYIYRARGYNVTFRLENRYDTESNWWPRYTGALGRENRITNVQMCYLDHNMRNLACSPMFRV